MSDKLKEIKEYINSLSLSTERDDINRFLEVADNFHDNGYFQWLVEQAERLRELEEEIATHAPRGRNYTNEQYVELLNENKHYHELLESIRYTQDIAKDIQEYNPDIKVIGPDDLLQHILKKVNAELDRDNNG